MKCDRLTGQQFDPSVPTLEGFPKKFKQKSRGPRPGTILREEFEKKTPPSQRFYKRQWPSGI